MYLDFFIEIPDVKGKITTKKKGSSVYVNYEIGRDYDPEKKYNVPKRVTIGKVSGADSKMMVPNQNFLTYFPEVDLPELKYNLDRSSCLKIGAHLVIKKMFDEYHLPELLGKYFDERELGLFLDLVAYSLVCENNAGQYYPIYAYSHPLFTESMHIYSDSKVSDFLCSMSGEESIGFLNDWNSTHDHREKIYISYDSTNKNSEAGNIDMVEFGNPKVDVGSPVFNYSIAYDTKNAKPLFYETYLGSIADISQLEYMLGKAKGYGYKNIGFIGGFKEKMRTSRRYNGYYAALHCFGLESNPSWVLASNWDEETCDKALREAHKKGDLPDASFVASDLMAISVLRTLFDLGVSVPNDVAVIGLSNIEISKYSNPPLTTISLPIHEMGKVAAAVLFDRIAGDDTPKKVITLPAELLKRFST